MIKKPHSVVPKKEQDIWALSRDYLNLPVNKINKFVKRLSYIEIQALRIVVNNEIKYKTQKWGFYLGHLKKTKDMTLNKDMTFNKDMPYDKTKPTPDSDLPLKNKNNEGEYSESEYEAGEYCRFGDANKLECTKIYKENDKKTT